ncbi:MAG: peptidoglycan DD-metalloendopeptidase family protein [Saprospiraceae bacterium]
MKKKYTNNFIESIQSSFDINPLMGSEFGLSDYFLLDLSPNNDQLPKIDSPEEMTDFLKRLRKDNTCHLAYGGYMEHRSLYQSPLFLQNGPIRNIHLAIDVWAHAGTPIYAPILGTVHSITYNSRDLDYGYTLILSHRHSGSVFYTLYGHLGKSIMHILKKGIDVKSGQLIGYLGEQHENGGWSPHVHCQIIIDLEGNLGDYPGVCAMKDRPQYVKNCPDPTLFILPKSSGKLEMIG